MVYWWEQDHPTVPGGMGRWRDKAVFMGEGCCQAEFWLSQLPQQHIDSQNVVAHRESRLHVTCNAVLQVADLLLLDNILLPECFGALHQHHHMLSLPESTQINAPAPTTACVACVLLVVLFLPYTGCDSVFHASGCDCVFCQLHHGLTAQPAGTAAHKPTTGPQHTRNR